MKTLIRQLCDAHGAGGYRQIADVIQSLLKDAADDMCVDAMGSVVAYSRSGKANAPLLMLEAHMDEIGFVVTHVDDKGFIRVANCGGIDRRVLAATEVVVLGEREMAGVFCSTPPHLTKGDEKLKVIEDMGIDIGLSVDEVKALVPKGTRVVFKNRYRELQNGRVCAKSLDNRAGCAAVIDAFRRLSKEQRECDVVALFAVQEEVGGAGASVAAFALTPHAAIVTDVSFACTPDAEAHKCGVLGEGAMLGIAPGLDQTLTETLKRVAKARQIPLQWEVMGDRTGTDADGIAFSREGIPTALLSIPQRYMHTPVEVVDVNDIKAVADLMVYAAKEGITVC